MKETTIFCTQDKNMNKNQKSMILKNHYYYYYYINNNINNTKMIWFSSFSTAIHHQIKEMNFKLQKKSNVTVSFSLTKLLLTLKLQMGESLGIYWI